MLLDPVKLVCLINVEVLRLNFQVLMEFTVMSVGVFRLVVPVRSQAVIHREPSGGSIRVLDIGGSVVAGPLDTKRRHGSGTRQVHGKCPARRSSFVHERDLTHRRGGRR